MKNEIVRIYNTVKGYKTYAVAIAAIIYGVYVKDANIVLFGLGLAGLRNGLATEVQKVLVSTTPIQTAKAEAPSIAAEVVSEVTAEVPAEAPVTQ